MGKTRGLSRWCTIIDGGEFGYRIALHAELYRRLPTCLTLCIRFQIPVASDTLSQVYGEMYKKAQTKWN